MNAIPNDVDWSATAAWIALIVSLAGTIIGPIVTTILTNRHQLKLRNMDLKEKSLSERDCIIRNCISSVGKCSAYMNIDSMIECGKNFHNAYAYIPTEQWPLLDDFFDAVINEDYERVKNSCSDVIQLLTSLLATIPQ